jgi:DNA-binding transcriptional MerR regulator
MSPKTYSTAEVAKKVGVSRQTLYNWMDAGLLEPEAVTAGNASIRLWTDSHVAKARMLKDTLKRGPKPKKGKRRAR